jgi:hypothetical protein
MARESEEQPMSITVEQHARARVVTGTADVTDARDEECGAVPIDLRYDPEASRSVSLSLPDLPGPADSPGRAPHDWVFTRELLERGLRGPASTSSGDVQVWPSGRVGTVVELHWPQGVAVVQFDASALTRFLRRTYAPVSDPAAPVSDPAGR